MQHSSDATIQWLGRPSAAMVEGLRQRKKMFFVPKKCSHCRATLLQYTTRTCTVAHSHVFVVFFFRPIYSPLPTTVRALHFYRVKTSALSSLVVSPRYCYQLVVDDTTTTTTTTTTTATLTSKPTKTNLTASYVLMLAAMLPAHGTKRPLSIDIDRSTSCEKSWQQSRLLKNAHEPRYVSKTTKKTYKSVR